MASTINASTSVGLVSTADTSGVLQLQTAGTTAVSIDASQAVTFSAGTANGVSYLNGSKVLTTGSALTFDGNGTLTIARPSGVGNTQITLTNNAGGASGFQFGQSAQSQQFFIYDTGAAKDRYLINSTGEHVWYGASEQMRLTSTGLGIGTSSPSRKLEVSGIFRQTDGTVQAEIASGGSVAYYGTNNNYPVAIQTNAVERARFDTSGNLGLGVTPSAWNSAFKVLQISQGAFGSQNNAQVAHMWSNAFYDSVGYKYIASTPATHYRQFNGLHEWYNAPSGTAGNAITFTQAMTLDASGNLGIGTTSPNASAILDAQSTTKGVRMPNMTTTQKNAIASPAAGLMVFDTTLAKLCVYSGSAWQTITSV
jgi:hypothetical protein